MSVFLQVLSPPLVEAALIQGLFEAVAGRIFDWIKDSIEAKQRDKRERNELVRNLFGYCRNADFFVGKKRVLTIDDLNAAIEILRLCIGTFSKKPNYYSEKGASKIDFERNLVCVGDINNNPVTKYALERATQPPYKFKQEQGNILTLTDNKTLFAPEYYPKNNVLIKDYSIVTQLTHLVPNSGLLGRKMLIVGGSTGAGTWGAALAIKERDEILHQIWTETKGRDFQAILSVDIEDKIPVNMNLLDIKIL